MENKFCDVRVIPGGFELVMGGLDATIPDPYMRQVRVSLGDRDQLVIAPAPHISSEGHFQELLSRVLRAIAAPLEPRFVSPLTPLPAEIRDCTQGQSALDRKLSDDLCALLSDYCGEKGAGGSEGAVTTLRRLLGELGDYRKTGATVVGGVLTVQSGTTIQAQSFGDDPVIGNPPDATVTHLSDDQASDIDRKVATEESADKPKGKGGRRRINQAAILAAEAKTDKPEARDTAVVAKNQPTISPLAVEQAHQNEMANLDQRQQTDRTDRAFRDEPRVEVDEEIHPAPGSERWHLMERLTKLLTDPPLPDTVDLLDDRDGRGELQDSAFVRLFFQQDVVRQQDEARKQPGYQVGRFKPPIPTEPLIELSEAGARSMADLLFAIEEHTEGQIGQIHLFCTLTGSPDLAAADIWEKFSALLRKREAAKAKLAAKS